VIRRMPAPGSLAEKALQERRRQKAAGQEEPAVATDGEGAVAVEPPRGSGQRQQPKRQNRAKRSASRAPAPAASKRPGEGSQRPGKSR
jgi:YidC/Oxa1 family membrane protein insertase